MSALYLDDKVIYFRKRADSPYFFFSLDRGAHWQTTKQTTETAARRWVQERYGVGKKAVSFAGPRLKEYVLPAFDRYVQAKSVAGDSLGKQYASESRRLLERFVLTDEIAEKRVGQITHGDFEDFQTRLIGKLEVLRLVLRRAHKRGEIERNPTDGVLKAKIQKSERSIYSAEELEKLFPADVWEKKHFSPWSGSEDYTAFIVAASSGLRKSEVLGLTWDAVHLEEGREHIEIRGSLKNDGKLGPTKSKRPRATPIFDFVLWPERRAVRALKELRKLYFSRRILATNPFVFGYADGTPRMGTWWAKHLRAALKTAKINRDRGEGKLPLDAHSLRHTLASYLKAAGLPSDLIRQFCGWSSESIQATYTHIDPELFGRIMKLVGGVT
jgi:integrase